MFARLAALWVVLSLVLLAGAAPAQQASPQQLSSQAVERPRHVFIISIDGGKPAVMLKSKMPRLFSLALQGTWTMQAQTIIPSLTLPAHTSMLTGVVMAKHKVTWNDYDPQAGVVQVPTVFQLAKAKGLKTALFAGKDKFKHLHVPGSLDKFAIPAYEAKTVAQAAATYIEAEKPHLCFIHFADADGAGHTFGWGSPQQIQAFEDADVALDLVLQAIAKAGILEQSVVIVSADHGGHERTHGTESPEDMQIPWIAWGKGIKDGWKIQTPVSTCDTAATALWLLDITVPAGWDGKVIMDALRSKAIR